VPVFHRPASADIRVFMNVVNIERSRSGDADPSCSCRNRAGSILEGAVIAWFSCRTVEGLQEDHAVAALHAYATPITGPAAHHSAGRHLLAAQPPDDLSPGEGAEVAEGDSREPGSEVGGPTPQYRVEPEQQGFSGRFVFCRHRVFTFPVAALRALAAG
jgi:hypothetical protein